MAFGFWRISIATVVLLLVDVAHAKSELPSLVDLYADIPHEFLNLVSDKDGKPLTIEERRSHIDQYDAKNGYLSLKSSTVDFLDKGALALFKRKDGGWILGMTLLKGDNTTHIVMLQRDDKVWKDVTKDVLPTITNSMVDKRAQELIPSFRKEKRKLSDSASGTYAYILPKVGRTIEVEVLSDAYTGSSRVVLWKLDFDGAKFKLRK